MTINLPLFLMIIGCTISYILIIFVVICLNDYQFIIILNDSWMYNFLLFLFLLILLLITVYSKTDLTHNLSRLWEGWKPPFRQLYLCQVTRFSRISNTWFGLYHLSWNVILLEWQFPQWFIYQPALLSNRFFPDC